MVKLYYSNLHVPHVPLQGKSEIWSHN